MQTKLKIAFSYKKVPKKSTHKKVHKKGTKSAKHSSGTFKKGQKNSFPNTSLKNTLKSTLGTSEHIWIILENVCLASEW